MSKKWKGPVTKVLNARFTPGSREHEEYKERQKKYYYANADANRSSARARVQRKRERNQQWMVNFMQGRSCESCGKDDTRVLALDHKDEHDKFANVADLVSRGAALEKIQEEVVKCRILCHNCHMLRTFEQIGGTYHSRLLPCTEEEFKERFKDVL